MRLKIIVYLTPSNDIIMCYTDNFFTLNVGERNGYNWKVLNVLYLYDGNFISKEKLLYKKNHLTKEKITISNKIKQIIKIIKQ